MKTTARRVSVTERAKATHVEGSMSTQAPLPVVRLRELLLDKFVAQGGRLQQKIKDTFSHYDKDRSGELERGECIECLRGVLNGVEDDKIATLIDHMDTDKSDTLSVNEITRFLVDAHETRHPPVGPSGCEQSQVPWSTIVWQMSPLLTSVAWLELQSQAA